jgi:hypothetical protein
VKALTVRQPWATLIASGAKRIETRGWAPGYRGRLAIHAAKGFPGSAKAVCLDEPFFSALTVERGAQQALALPFGAIIATADLVEVLRIGPSSSGWRPPGGERERAFGDYRDGRYAWLLVDVEPLAVPVPAKGALGLWEWHEESAA